MKTRIIIFLALLGLGIPSGMMAQKRVNAADFKTELQVATENDAVHTATPAMVWDKTTADLGKLEFQKPAAGEFKVTNKGSNPMTIVQVSASCGCTAPSYPKEPIKPGQSGTIKLEYDSKVPGKFSKTATVRWSDGSREVLTIKGEVGLKK